jgi:hypothetical protein
MKLRRSYFISDDLDDLEAIEEQLEQSGIDTAQIHVLSENDAEVEKHRHLHDVQSLMKKDIVRSTMLGAAVGLIAFVLVLTVAYAAGWTQTAAGWIPFIFLAVVLLGFCAWEGGLFGIHRMNHAFARFRKALHEGKHVFFVDVEPSQEPILEQVMAAHPKVRSAGTGHAAPRWLIGVQVGVRKVLRVWP